ncbi:hypothetical protein Psta_4725 [Pirellula staleyi DSM 6068]|uniref:Uncharacterized protein n=1 Tax=Pirellula staleyi (strain ATCC 27377 / DSM 6068 / ICPB 4128) TaxID=530564 RepID=D2R835_PIRSD|nr:hypothetical protein [Pirellula staleyi]ADB19366.1 hypothetical protein Psta_4725 [Pirellula staleyi DSM 6068]
MTQDINVLALVKGEERYIFLFDDAHRSEALRTLGRFASNPQLSFSWYDAAVLSQRIRQVTEEAEEARAAAEAETVAADPVTGEHDEQIRIDIQPMPKIVPQPHMNKPRFKLPLPSDNWQAEE